MLFLDYKINNEFMKEYIENLLEELSVGDCQIFDVREKQEWDRGFITGSVLQPLSLLKIGKLLHSADKNKKTYLYCSSGKRVFSAAEILKAMGFRSVIPLREGIFELKSLGIR